MLAFQLGGKEAAPARKHGTLQGRITSPETRKSVKHRNNHKGNMSQRRNRFYCQQQPLDSSCCAHGQLATACAAATCFQQQCIPYGKAAQLPVVARAFLYADVAAVTIGSQLCLLTFRASCNLSVGLTAFLHPPQPCMHHVSASPFTEGGKAHLHTPCLCFSLH